MSKKQQSKKIIASDSEEDSDQDAQEMTVGQSDQWGAQESNFHKEDDKKRKDVEHNVVHLHFQQRTTRKCLTLVQGLPDDLDLKKIVRAFKKAWCCNGTTHEHEEWGNIIQLQGDNRRAVMKFLMEEGICTKEQIKVHGY